MRRLAMAGAAVGVLAAVLWAASWAPSGGMRVEGTDFVGPDGRRFAWRGVTAFALLDQLARGRDEEAEAFLRWAGDRGFTVVRVLGMAHYLFRLSPSQGVEALPRLLALAAKHDMVVELVVFADTRAFSLDYAAHVDSVAVAAEGAPNLVIELANENVHPSQDPRISEPGRLLALRARLPRDIPVSLGSLHGGDLSLDRFPGGDYVTIHPSRSGDPWRHVSLTATLARLQQEAGKPVVNDEPIGAGERPERSRRSADPSVFFGLGLLGRMGGVATTFHCEDCIQARPPGPRQEESARAFIEGDRLLPERRRFSLRPGLVSEILGREVAVGASSIHAASDEAREWTVVAALGAPPRLALPWAAGWRGDVLARKPGIAVFRASRR